MEHIEVYVPALGEVVSLTASAETLRGLALHGAKQVLNDALAGKGSLPAEEKRAIVARAAERIARGEWRYSAGGTGGRPSDPFAAEAAAAAKRAWRALAVPAKTADAILDAADGDGVTSLLAAKLAASKGGFIPALAANPEWVRGILAEAAADMHAAIRASAAIKRVLDARAEAAAVLDVDSVSTPDAAD